MRTRVVPGTPSRLPPLSRTAGPPLLEPGGRLLFAERALVEAKLHQEGQRLPHRAARADPEDGHDLVPVEVGAEPVELLLLAQLRDAGLELVHAPGQRAGLGGVAGRAVTAGQLVEQIEVGTGVPHVAAHRLVGPAQLVGVEAQVQLDQAHHGVDVGRRVVQRLHARARHARADHFVVMERHAAVGDGARARLADVVEERREAQQPVAATSCPPRRTCGRGRLCGGESDPVRARGRAAREGILGPGRCARRTTAHPTARRASASCPARRGCARPRQWRAGRACARLPPTSAGSGSRLKRAAKRAARNMRSGSSPKEISGSSGVRRRPAARSPSPSKGSMSSMSGRRRASALIVKSRRDRSTTMSSPKVTSGLRDSGT